MRFAVVRWVRLVKYFSKREVSTAAACDDGQLLGQVLTVLVAGHQRNTGCRMATTSVPTSTANRWRTGPFSPGSGGGNGIVVGRPSRRYSIGPRGNIDGMSDSNPEVRLP